MRIFNFNTDPCVLIGKDYWDTLGGVGFYEEVLAIADQVGERTASTPPGGRGLMNMSRISPGLSGQDQQQQGLGATASDKLRQGNTIGDKNPVQVNEEARVDGGGGSLDHGLDIMEMGGAAAPGRQD